MNTEDQEDIRFISHSCILISVGDCSLLCDPWFFGKVFNDSWNLLLPPLIENLDFSRVRHVWISHEHPDHFNVPTLRFLKEKLPVDVTFYYRRQRKKNVVDFLRKMEFHTVEVPEGKEVEMPGIGTISGYHCRDDTALLIRTPRSTILNLNDCQLRTRKSRLLARKAGKIDYLLYQFSLAGFCGDPDDIPALERRQRMHLNRIERYISEFDPKWYVPFASFVAFCTPDNEFMNKWRVSLDMVAKRVPPEKLQIVFNADSLVDSQELALERNPLSIERWQNVIDELQLDMTERPVVDEELILEKAEKFIGSFDDWPRFSLPGQVEISLTDIGKTLLLDFSGSKVGLSTASKKPIIAAMSSYAISEFLANPWGADTLNISAEASVYDIPRWRWLAFAKQYQYKPLIPTKLGHYAPRLYAWLKPYL